jgi:hypothetical protein
VSAYMPAVFALECPACGSSAFGRERDFYSEDEEQACEDCGALLAVAIEDSGHAVAIERVSAVEMIAGLREALATETARREQAERERDEWRRSAEMACQAPSDDCEAPPAEGPRLDPAPDPIRDMVDSVAGMIEREQAAEIIRLSANCYEAAGNKPVADAIRKALTTLTGEREPTPITVDGWTWSPADERYEGPDGVSAYVHAGELTIEREGVGWRSGTDGSIPIAVAVQLLPIDVADERAVDDLVRRKSRSATGRALPAGTGEAGDQ